MAFRLEDDPYPLSLPTMDSSDIDFFGEPSSGEGNHVFGAPYPGVAANDFETPHAEDAFSNTIPFTKSKLGTAIQPATLAATIFHSTESSPASSSSSSTQHHRHASSNSSRSVTFETGSFIPDETQMHRLKIENSKMGAPSPKRSLDVVINERDADQQMNDLFDFDSAANSPGDSVATETSSNKPIAGIAMPQNVPSPHQTQKQILQPQEPGRVDVRVHYFPNQAIIHSCHAMDSIRLTCFR